MNGGQFFSYRARRSGTSLRTQTGLVYVEQVMGDMTLQVSAAIFI